MDGVLSYGVESFYDTAHKSRPLPGLSVRVFSLAPFLRAAVRYGESAYYAAAGAGASTTPGVESVGGKFSTFLNNILSYIPLFGASITGGSTYKSENASTRNGLLNARISVVVDEIDETAT